MKIRVGLEDQIAELGEQIAELKAELWECKRFTLVPKDGDIILEAFTHKELGTVFVKDGEEIKPDTEIRRISTPRDLVYDWNDIFQSLDGQRIINDLLLKGLGYEEHLEVNVYLDTYKLLVDCLKQENVYYVSVETYRNVDNYNTYDFVLWYKED